MSGQTDSLPSGDSRCADGQRPGAGFGFSFGSRSFGSRCAALFVRGARAAGAYAVTTLVAGTVLAGALAATAKPAKAETRTLNLYYTHTGESAQITFKKDGKFIPSGLRQLNQFLRDWRRNEATRMDPALFDLIWEVYQKTGSHSPIRIVSAYRSPATNNMLRRRTRGVAKNSQHTYGKAMDFYLADVSITKIREIGLRMQVGGVGFYPTANTPFVHLDTGSVRHWPRMTRDQLVRVFPNGHTLHVPSDGKPLPGFEEALADYEARKNGERRAIAAIDNSKGGSGGGFFASFTGKQQTDDSQMVRPAPGKGKFFLAALFGGGADEEEDNASAAAGDDEGGAPAPVAAPAPAKAPAAPAAAAVAASDAALPGVRNALPGTSLEAAPAKAAPAAQSDDDEAPAAVPPPARPAAPGSDSIGTFVAGAQGIPQPSDDEPSQRPVAVVPILKPADAPAAPAVAEAVMIAAAQMPVPRPEIAPASADAAAPADQEADPAVQVAAAYGNVLPEPRPAGDPAPVTALGYAGGAVTPPPTGDGDVLAETARAVLRGSRITSRVPAALPPASLPPVHAPLGAAPAVAGLAGGGADDPLAFLGGSAGVPSKTDPRLLSNQVSVRSQTFAQLSKPDYRSLNALLAPPASPIAAAAIVASDSFVVANAPAVDHFSGAADQPMTASR